MARPSLMLSLLALAGAHAATITIGALIDSASDATPGGGEPETFGAILAVQRINANSSLLGGHTVQLSWLDDGPSRFGAMSATCALARAGVHAIAGPSWSSTTAHVLPITTSLGVPLISYSATSPTLKHGVDAPFYGRVVPSDASAASAIAGMVSHYNWTRICVLFQDDTYGTQGALLTRSAAARRGIRTLAALSYSAATRNATDVLPLLASSGCRVIVHWAVDPVDVMTQANEAGLVRGGDYVWILSDGCDMGLANPSYWGPAGAGGLQQAFIGSLCVVPSVEPGAGRTAFLAAWAAAGRTDTPTNYALYMHDAVYAAAHALAEVPAALAAPFTLAAGEDCVPDAGSAGTTPTPWAHGAAVLAALERVSFVGATSGAGHVAFNSELERSPAKYAVYNFAPDIDTLTQHDGHFRIVASLSVESALADSDPLMTASVAWSVNEAQNAQPPSDVLPRTVRVKTVLNPPYVALDTKNAFCTTCIEAGSSATWDGPPVDCPDMCYTGLAMDALRGVATIASFSFDIQHFQVDDRYSDLLRRALTDAPALSGGRDELSDVVVGDWTATEERSSFVQTSYPYFDTGLILLRRKDTAASRPDFELSASLSAIFRPFRGEVWALIVGYVILLAFFFGFYEQGLNESIPSCRSGRPTASNPFGGAAARLKASREEGEEPDAPTAPPPPPASPPASPPPPSQGPRTSSTADTLDLVLAKGARLMLATKRTRWLQSIWVPFYWSFEQFTGHKNAAFLTLPAQVLSAAFAFCNLLLISSYTANLAAFLTVSRVDVAITGVENIGSSLVPFRQVVLSTLGGSVEKFWIRQFPGSPCFNCNGTEYHSNEWGGFSHAVAMLKNQSNTANFVIVDAHTGMYAAQSDCEIEAVGDIFYAQGYSFLLRPGSLLGPHVSTAILEMREKLQLDTITKSYFDGGKCGAAADDTGAGALESNRMGLNDLGGIFVIGAIFIGASMLAYLMLVLCNYTGSLNSRGLTRRTKGAAQALAGLEASLARARDRSAPAAGSTLARRKPGSGENQQV